MARKTTRKTAKPTGQTRSAPRMALCLGAHRSGTSLVSAALSVLGAELALPETAAAASEENRKGFFEHPEAVAINDALLDLAGSAWDDPLFDSARLAALEGDALAALRRRAALLLRRDWRDHPLSAVKDPRMCRLLPFWQEVLAEQGYASDDLRLVLVLRDPVEVAISQRSRSRKDPGFYDFGQHLDEGAALWLSHLRQAIRDSGDTPLFVLSYADFLTDPAPLMEGLAAHLGVRPDPAAVQKFCAGFVDDALWRSHATPEDRAALEAAFPGLAGVAADLAALSGRVAGPGDLAPLLARLNRPDYDARLQDLAARAYGRLSARRRAAALHLRQARDDLDSTAAARDAFERSREDLARDMARSETALRDQLAALEQGVQSRDAALNQLREEQAQAIRQLADSAARAQDQSTVEHDRLTRSLSEQKAVYDGLRDAHDLLVGQLASSGQALAHAQSERDGVAHALEDLRQAHDALIAERDSLQHTQREFAAQLDEAQNARAELAAENDNLRAHRDDLHTVHESLIAERDRLTQVEALLVGERDQLAQQLSGVIAERDARGAAMEAAQRRAADLEHSRSWRVTAPLRRAGGLARRGKALPKAGLRGVNRLAERVYPWLKRRAPRLAEAVRRRVQPLLSRANMRVLGQYTAPPPVPVPAGGDDARYSFDFQQPQIFAPYRPLVSVIVPNYNHAPYLAQRIDSILAQSYDNLEILLLDDCSSDDSRAVLSDYAARHPDRIRLLLNDTNSGGVFYQWEKGLAAARGELVWMAESDDWASPNFLETLVPFFQNEAVQLAYARSVFMDAAGENQIWSMEEYLAEFGPERWGHAWVETSADIVRDVMSMTNIIPNVSSALFRRFDRLDVLEIDQWRQMRTCGDWMFYLNALRGGMLAYSPDAQNFYRIHENNTSVTSHKADQFYREHEDVARCLRRHYRVPEDNLTRLEDRLRRHWQITRDDYSEAAFAACFDRARIVAAPQRKPSVLMAGYAFCAGGGETFPIQLANEIKALGHEVTFLDCAREERLSGTRAMLANDIPVVSNFADLGRIVQHFDIDLVHSHHGWVDNTMLDLLPEEGAARTVVTLHGFYETVPEAQLRVILPRLVSRSGGLVYTARKNLDAIRKMGLEDQRPIHRIDNALSKSHVTPVDRADLGIAPDAFVLTMVARGLFSKGWLEAVEAVDHARAVSGRDIHLIMIGEGEARDALLDKGVGDHIHLLGFRDNIRDYFAASDLGFLPSRFPGESFPLVVIDSLNAGAPVLASDIGEIRYMLTNADGALAGALFALDEDWNIDAPGLGDQIAALAGDGAEMAALKARVPAAAARFDPRLMAERYSAVYDRAIDGETA